MIGGASAVDQTVYSYFGPINGPDYSTNKRSRSNRKRGSSRKISKKRTSMTANGTPDEFGNRKSNMHKESITPRQDSPRMAG